MDKRAGDRELIEAAIAAREMAYTPYSHFRVGAALRTAQGKVYRGCNIENAAYSPSICAERVAVSKAVSEGHRDFARIAIAADTDRFTSPCGVCRQVLWEFAPDLEVLLYNRRGEIQELTLRQLLPYSFDSTALEE